MTRHEHWAQTSARAVTAEYASMDDCAAAISKVTGQVLKYVEVPRDAAAAAGYPGAANIANMCVLAGIFTVFHPLPARSHSGRTGLLLVLLLLQSHCMASIHAARNFRRSALQAGCLL